MDRVDGETVETVGFSPMSCDTSLKRGVNEIFFTGGYSCAHEQNEGKVWDIR